MSRNWFFGLTSRLIMIIVAGLLVLSYVSIVVNPAKAWYISLFGLLFVPLSIVNALLLLWAIKRRSKSFVIPMMALLPAVFFVGRYIQFEKEDLPQEGDRIKVLTYNVGRFHMYDDGIESKSECIDSVFAFIKEQDADIVCLQEFYVRDINKVRYNLSRLLPDYHAEYYLYPQENSGFGNLTLSRYPVKDKGRIKFDSSANLAIYTDYEVEGRKFRVYNCHFESYNISFSGMIHSIVNKESDVFTKTGNKMKISISRRPKQVDKVFSHIESCPVEAFVCGDFNDNPMSYTYYRMRKGRKDSFIEAGKGFGSTYSIFWPMLRIDYVLFPDSFEGVSHETIRKDYSDHYPVVTEIAL